MTREIVKMFQSRNDSELVLELCKNLPLTEELVCLTFFYTPGNLFKPYGYREIRGGPKYSRKELYEIGYKNKFISEERYSLFLNTDNFETETFNLERI